METTIAVKRPIAPRDWDFMDSKSPATRVLGTASALEALAEALRAADAAYTDVETLRTLVVGSGDLVEVLAIGLHAQATRMEECPYCAHATIPLEVQAEPDGDGNGRE